VIGNYRTYVTLSKFGTMPSANKNTETATCDVVAIVAHHEATL
jgi:hypothetical protein